MPGAKQRVLYAHEGPNERISVFATQETYEHMVEAGFRDSQWDPFANREPEYAPLVYIASVVDKDGVAFESLVEAPTGYIHQFISPDRPQLDIAGRSIQQLRRLDASARMSGCLVLSIQ